MGPHRSARAARRDRPRQFYAALVLAAAAALVSGAGSARGATTLVSAGAVNGSGAVNSFFQQASADGSRAFFVTSEQLVAGDTDGAFDVYERSGGATTLVSAGAINGNGDFDASFMGASSDGSVVFFLTREQLVSADTDDAQDVYRRSGGTTTLVSAGAINGDGAFGATFRGASADGSRIFFVTMEQLVSADTDGAFDVYERSGGTTTLVSAGSNGIFGSFFRGASADGSRVFFETMESLVSADTDSSEDVYERAGGATTLVSAGGNDDFGASFVGASSDGTRVFFETGGRLVGADTDSATDVYERSGGTTKLASAGGTTDASASFAGASSDGSRVFFVTVERLVAGDTDSAADLYQRSGGATALVSTGEINGNGAFDASFAGASTDGTRVFFQSQEQLAAADTDASMDVYERAGAVTALVSVDGTGSVDAFFAGASADGSRVFFQTTQQLTSADTDGAADLYDRSGGATRLVSTGAINGNGELDALFAGASIDGVRVFFQTQEQLVSADADDAQDVYLAETAAADPSPPTTTLALAPTTPNGANGWYRTAVHVSATVGSGSGAIETRCVLDPGSSPASFGTMTAGCPFAGGGADVLADGVHTVWAASVDGDGDEEAPASVSFKLDRTPPSVTCPATPTFQQGGTGGQISASVTDAASGTATPAVSAPADVSSAGPKSVSLTGLDLAGNARVVQCAYVVEAPAGSTISGLALDLKWPTAGSRHRAGSWIFVTFRLKDAKGKPISDRDARRLARSCAATVTITGGERRVWRPCAHYDRWWNAFEYWLKTPRDLRGRQTITVAVSVGGTVQTASVDVLMKP